MALVLVNCSERLARQQCPKSLLIGLPNMQQRGVLQRWLDDKAYGFIRPEGGGQDVFVHLRDFGQIPRRPKVGDAVTFQSMADGNGRFRAADVAIDGLARHAGFAGPPPARPAESHRSGDFARAQSMGDGNGRSRAANGPQQGLTRRTGVRTRPPARHVESSLNPLALCVVVLFFLALGAGVYFARLPWFIPLAYLMASGVTFLAYAFDKSAAMNGQWRTQEDLLHLLELAGGWPGALLAQGLFRHKTRKASFQAMFWAMVVLNLGGLGWLATNGKAALLMAGG